MKLARIPLHSPPPTFQPQPGRIARVTLAWWEDGELVLVPSQTGAARTLVVVWPTDSNGYMDLPATYAGRVEVLPWDLSPQHFECLRTFSSSWPLQQHDLYVWASKLGPCLHTNRGTLYWAGLDGRIEAEISRLESAEPNASPTGISSSRTAS